MPEKSTPDSTAETATADVEVSAETPRDPDAASAPVNVPPSRRFWTRLDNPFVAGFLLTLGGLAAFSLGAAITNISTVIIYIVFALFIALGIDPVVRWLSGRGLSRTWSIVITIVGLLAIIVGMMWLVIPTVVDQVTQFVQSVPSMIKDFMHSDLFHRLEGMFGEGFESLIGDIQKFLSDPGNIAAIGGGAFQVGATIFSGLSGVLIVLVLTLYFVASLPQIKSAMYELAPARNRARISDLTDQITDSIGGYLGGMVVLAFFNAVFSGVLYAILGLPFPLLMSVVAFCITLIPLVGSVLFWAVASVLALFTSPLSALLFALIYIAYVQVEAYVLTPRVMSRAISIPGSLVVIGALIGGTLLGLLGALVAIPVTASILLIIKQVWIPRQNSKK
ncbi:putative PurR-regulated permease PerM [Mycetocola sp. BIGb0189]|uniref:AI-2E family transporter n=1 Tax=Mycetocola sp. BIGb0189 TaxID=2940604 RepID=UPI0021679E59|nr:AI-2E family transporter [Mycetocola sp. BIGb0189]MCS4275235.1 putative PurR-regulated permease PerM [Mycetocola sp. BIGb0189]